MCHGGLCGVSSEHSIAPCRKYERRGGSNQSFSIFNGQSAGAAKSQPGVNGAESSRRLSNLSWKPRLPQSVGAISFENSGGSIQTKNHPLGAFQKQQQQGGPRCADVTSKSTVDLACTYHLTGLYRHRSHKV